MLDKYLENKECDQVPHLHSLPICWFLHCGIRCKTDENILSKKMESQINQKYL